MIGSTKNATETSEEILLSDLPMSPDVLAARVKSNRTFADTMETFFRISLAGFGGALVGLSLSKSQGSRQLARVVQRSSFARRQQPQQQTQTGRPTQLQQHLSPNPPTLKKLPKSTQDLPAQWAVACVTFSALFEGTRLWNPTAILTEHKIVQTLGDYTIAGALAGTLLRGMPVGTRVTPRLGAGLFAGLVLGFIPGVFVAGITVLEEQLKEMQQLENEQQTYPDETLGEKKPQTNS